MTYMPALPRPLSPPRPAASPFFVTVLLVLLAGGAATALNFFVLGYKLPLSTLLATVLALVPLGLLLWFYGWLSPASISHRRFFPLGFLWGAVGAAGIALVANTVSVAIFGTFAGVVVLAPLTEELLKGGFILLVFLWRRADFDGPLDGILYAAFVAMGFAFTENITYFTAAYSGLSLFDDGGVSGGVGALTVSFFLRGLVTLFAHPLFTGMTGLALGLAVRERSGWVRAAYGLVGFTVAFLLHALWNGLLTEDFASSIPFIYVIVFFPVFSTYLYLCWRSQVQAAGELELSLRELVAYGLLPASTLPWLSDKPSRSAALSSSVGGGPQAVRSMEAYQKQALRFAALQSKVRNGVAPAEYVALGQYHFFELQRLSAALPYFPPHR